MESKMNKVKQIRLGVIGVGNRGHGLIPTILAHSDVEIVAICDLYADRVEAAIETVKKISGKAPKGYANYRELIADEAVEAVVIATSWDMHVDCAVASMRAGKYTALEVGGAYDVEDCWMLVRTYEETKTPIMLLENCCFDKFELTATALARAGRFGKIVHCHGAYGHELLGEILGGEVDRHYRLKNYTLRNCENYPTHEFGPIAKLLDINRGNKMLTLSAVSTKAGVGLSECANSDRTPDPNQRGKSFNQGDMVFTTIKCSNGEIVTLTLDTTLARFYSREFTVRGTQGLASQDNAMILFADEVNMHSDWIPDHFIGQNMNNVDKYSDYVPECWKNVTDEQLSLGHGGIDYFEFGAFFKAIREGTPMPIDVYDMAAWMVITPLSEQSIALGGAPVPVPDFTRGKWMYRPSEDVVELPRPKKETSGCEEAPPLGHSRP